MEVFRITKNNWANSLSGSGRPARWNSKGVYMVYTAWSRSLACLENRVHMPFQGKDFALSTIEIPNLLKIEEIGARSLPKNWDLSGPPGYAICQQYGDKWIKEGISAILKVPSAIIYGEFNYLINPGHKDSNKIKITSVNPFSFDSRLF